MKTNLLSLEVTTKCNLNCINCFVQSRKKNQTSMNWKTALDITLEGFALGFRELHITGGEPLLWEHLFRLLDAACESGYNHIYINTNATLLNRKMCKMLAVYNKRIRFSCSINGKKETHEFLRGRHSYKNALKGLSHAIKHGLAVDIFTTLSKNLLPDIPFFVDSLFSRLPDIRTLFFLQLRRTENNWPDMSEQMLSAQDYINVIRNLGALSLFGYPVTFLESALYNVVAKLLKLTWLPGSLPIYRSGRLTVLQNGKITANHTAGRVYSKYKPGILKTVLQSDCYRNDMTGDTKTCPRCRFILLCRNYGLLRPSSTWYTGKNEIKPFCMQVLNELKNHAVH